MILSELKNILQQRKAANLFELTHYLKAEPDAVRGMLAHWIRKGYVRRCKQLPGCGTKCGKCSPLLTEIYEWIEVPH